ncbi:hypothetical protein ACHAWF_008628 [Thalassiosira exigua]
MGLFVYYTTAALLLISPIYSSTAFVNPNSSTIRRHKIQNRHVLSIRGGDINIESMTSSSSALSSVISPATDALHQALVTGGPLKAIGALYAVASLTVLPLTLIKTYFSFSVGYGLSVATMSLALLSAFAPPMEGSLSSWLTSSTPMILAATAFVYGVRLAAFIFVRAQTVESKRKAMDAMDDKTPPLKRIPLALGVSILYAFMMSPVLFSFRRGSMDSGSLSQKVQVFFAGVAIFGTVLESIADQHKYEVKRRSKEGEDKFIGPTTWSYRLCRHPNYLGEILHWVGLFGAGSVTFGKSIVAWVCSCLGIWGIVRLMLGSSKGLDKKQSDKYKGQPAYEDWTTQVTSSVIPFVK